MNTQKVIGNRRRVNVNRISRWCGKADCTRGMHYVYRSEKRHVNQEQQGRKKFFLNVETISFLSLEKFIVIRKFSLVSSFLNSLFNSWTTKFTSIPTHYYESNITYVIKHLRSLLINIILSIFRKYQSIDYSLLYEEFYFLCKFSYQVVKTLSIWIFPLSL